MRTLVFAVLSAAALSAAPPFPPPVLTSVDEGLKFTSGTVATVDGAAGTLTVASPAGLVTFKTSQAQVVGADKQRAALAPGQKVYVYFHLGDGAVANEIDVQPS